MRDLFTRFNVPVSHLAIIDCDSEYCVVGERYRSGSRSGKGAYGVTLGKGLGHVRLVSHANVHIGDHQIASVRAGLRRTMAAHAAIRRFLLPPVIA